MSFPPRTGGGRALGAEQHARPEPARRAPYAPEPPPAAAATTAPPADRCAAALYQRFRGEVAHAQLAAWLPAEPSLVLDLSRRSPRLVELMVARGHTVVHAVADGAVDADAARDTEIRDTETAPAEFQRSDLPAAVTGPGRLLRVRGDAQTLGWLGAEVVDAVVAEGGALSEALAAELTVDDLHRVLRPGGRVLLCVDSLVSGLARLADQGCWAELADVPAADVVLVPTPDGGVSRCFWPEELHEMLVDAGFDVEWVRPRTVLAEETVVRALRLEPEQLSRLVTTELALSRRRQGESVGAQLVASAVRR